MGPGETKLGYRLLRTLLHVAAGVVHVTLGVFFPAFLLSRAVGTGFLVVCAVGLPALARRVRR